MSMFKNICAGIALVLCCVFSISAASPTIYSEKGKYGLKNPSTGEVILKPTYDKIGEFIDGYALVVKKQKYGLINTAGTEYLPCKYLKIMQPEVFPDNKRGNEFFLVSKGDNKYFLASKSKNGTHFYDDVFYAPNGRWWIKYDGQWYEVDSKGKIERLYVNRPPNVINLTKGYVLFGNDVYSPDKKRVLSGVNSVSSTKKIGGRNYQVLKSGTNIAGLIDTSTGEFYKKEFGDNYINASNEGFRVEHEKVLPLKVLSDRGNKLYAVENPEFGLFGIQKDDKRILPFHCNGIRWVNSGYKANGKDVYFLYLDGDNHSYYEGHELFNELDKWDIQVFVIVNGEDLYNSKGTFLASGFTALNIFNDQITLVENGAIVKMNLDGVREIKGYDETFSNGGWRGFDPQYIGVKKNGKYGLYQEDEGEIIPPLYDDFEAYGCDVKARKGNLYGLFDSDGKLIFEPKYKWISALDNNNSSSKSIYEVTSSDGRCALMNRAGKVLVPFGTVDSFSWQYGSDRDKWCWVKKMEE